MKKEEILARSKKENIHGDEWYKAIEKTANQTAFLAIESVYAVLIVILVIQKLITGKAFADYQVFLSLIIYHRQVYLSIQLPIKLCISVNSIVLIFFK